ncbi:MAG TPA: MarR family transcriptional regulator [Daejeonella sp.]|nr:MarR family transcriptional regulator [Daejeonella sp.]
MIKHLAHSLISVSKKYRSSLLKELPDLNIDKYQYVMVLIDDYHENLSQTTLAELLQIDKSQMVNILNYLTDKGYVHRETNVADRRERLVKLSAEAKRVVPLIRGAIAKLNNQSFRNLSERQVRDFTTTLQTIQNNLSGGK